MSNTSNASYIEQVVTYVLDFGNVNYKTLAGGFDMFNFNIANNLLDPQLGLANTSKTKFGGIFINHELSNITKTHGLYTLSLNKKNTFRCKLIKSHNIFVLEYIRNKSDR